MHDLHGAAAEHVRGTDHDGIAEAIGDGAGFAGRARDAAFGLPQAELLDQLLEAVAVLGEIDGVGRGAEDRDAGVFQRVRRASAASGRRTAR